MPNVSEWVTFLNNFDIPQADLDITVESIMASNVIAQESDPCLVYFEIWWKAHPNSFINYCYVDGYDAWKASNPNYQRVCA